MLESVYIHIPFCKEICSYCDFCKVYYHTKWVDEYLNILEKEIKENYHYEVIKTIYMGGGTPSSLSILQLERLFQIIQIFQTDPNLEFTIECNIENTTIEKLKLFQKYSVNRLSFGIESFQPKVLEVLNRKTNYHETKRLIDCAKKMGFQNINVDLIYAVSGQSFTDLKKDIDLILSLEVEHISTYSLIIEENTKLFIKNYQNIEEELDRKMYEYIQEKLQENGYQQYEISNFSKPGYASSHNMVYWNNLEYYGFGLGASGYVNGVRYTNTRSLKNYFRQNYLLEQEPMTKKQKMENEMILGLRKREGVNQDLFKQKYHQKIEDVFPIQDLFDKGKLEIMHNYIKIPKKYIYTSNDILIYFLLD